MRTVRSILIFALAASVFIPLIVCPNNIYCDSWLNVEVAGENKVWVDTSHWETSNVYVEDGYYRNVEKKRWVDTSYTVSQGYWKTDQYQVWVQSSASVPYTAYRYVDTSHYETTYTYVTVQKPVYFTLIFGTNSYGWSVYSFAAQFKGLRQVTYNGEKYLANVYVIDYRPSKGGRIYAEKYVFIIKFVVEQRSSTKWVTSGYNQAYTAYRTVDTSHYETRTNRYWVDTSYRVDSGYWETYTEKQWVDTSYFKNVNIWVNSGYYTEPLHGKLTVQKSPGYIFTRWHKDSDGKECGMDLIVSWELDNSLVAEGEPVKKIASAYIYQETVRYKDRGIEKLVIHDGPVNPSDAGSVETFSKFDFAGSEDSILHIYLYSGEGEVIHAYFSNPINGFKSMNINYGGTGSNADSFSGGNYYGEAIF